MKKYLIAFLFVINFVFAANGQFFLSEKRIYLLDVTASMEGNGAVATPNIFEDVKIKLADAISDLEQANTEIVVIPFTNTTFEPICGNISEKDSITHCVEQIKIRRGDTDIATAFQKGIEELDSTKVNYLFLLTDGLHNCGVEKDSLYQLLSSWNDVSRGKYMFAFYVMLTPNAKELELIQVVENTNQMWPIESMDVNVSFLLSSMNISANINNNKVVKIPLVSNNNKIFNNNIECQLKMNENPYYKIKNYKIDFPNRNIEFEVEEGALHLIAQKAKARKMGARALRTIMEDVLFETKFSVPGDKTVEKIIVRDDLTVDVIRKAEKKVKASK